MPVPGVTKPDVLQVTLPETVSVEEPKSIAPDPFTEKLPATVPALALRFADPLLISRFPVLTEKDPDGLKVPSVTARSTADTVSIPFPEYVEAAFATLIDPVVRAAGEVTVIEPPESVVAFVIETVPAVSAVSVPPETVRLAAVNPAAAVSVPLETVKLLNVRFMVEDVPVK